MNKKRSFDEIRSIVWFIATTLVYVIVFLVTSNRLGTISGIFLILPVVVASYNWGQYFGVMAGIFFPVINIALYSIYTPYSPNAIRDSLFGIPVACFVGWLTGRLKTLISRNVELEKLVLPMKLGIERSKDVVFMTDSKGVFLYINPAFTTLYGYMWTDVEGKTPRVLKSGLQDNSFYESFWSKLVNKQRFEAVIVNKNKLGALITVEASVNPIIENGGKLIGFLAIQRDVTERKAIEDNLFRQKKDLERLNKLMVDRELKMVELKKEINKYKKI